MIRPLLSLLLLTSIATGAEKQLFNGTDLSGWDGNRELWSVKDGAITGTTVADAATPEKSTLKHNTFLIWRGGTVSDFELMLKYRIVAGNSGVQFRSKELPSGEHGPIMSGYQADFEAGTTYSGILYEEKGRGILAQRGESVTITDGEKPKKPTLTKGEPVGDSNAIQAAIKSEDWNEYKIVAQGGHIQHFINGMKTVEVKDESTVAAKEGLLGLQIHAGPPMIVQFKDIVLKTAD
jgi:hypothetical protein